MTQSTTSTLPRIYEGGCVTTRNNTLFYPFESEILTSVLAVDEGPGGEQEGQEEVEQGLVLTIKPFPIYHGPYKYRVFAASNLLWGSAKIMKIIVPSIIYDSGARCPMNVNTNVGVHILSALQVLMHICFEKPGLCFRPDAVEDATQRTKLIRANEIAEATAAEGVDVGHPILDMTMLRLLGSKSSPTFTYDVTSSKKSSMDRVVMTETYIYKEHCPVENQPDAPKPTLLKDERIDGVVPAATIFTFYVIDPRMDLQLGIRNLILDNVAREAKRELKKPEADKPLNSSGHSTNSRGDTRLVDRDVENEQRWNVLPCYGLKTIEDWGRLAIHAGHSERIEKKLRTTNMGDMNDALYTSGALDPCYAFDGNYKFEMRDIRRKVPEGEIGEAEINTIMRHPAVTKTHIVSYDSDDAKIVIEIDGVSTQDPQVSTVQLNRFADITVRLPRNVLYTRVFFNLQFMWINNDRRITYTNPGSVDARPEEEIFIGTPFARPARTSYNYIIDLWLGARGKGINLCASMSTISCFHRMFSETEHRLTHCAEGGEHLIRCSVQKEVTTCMHPSAPDTQRSMLAIWAWMLESSATAIKGSQIFSMFDQIPNKATRDKSYSGWVVYVYETFELDLDINTMHEMGFICTSLWMNHYRQERDDLTLTLLNLGDAGAGKSHIQKIVMSNMMINGTVHKVNGSSAKANSTGECDDLKAIWIDEMEDKFMKRGGGPNGDTSGNQDVKTQMSNASNVYDRVHLLDSGRTVVKTTITDHINSTVMNANATGIELNTAVIDRMLINFTIKVKRRDKFGKRPVNDDKRRVFKDQCSKRQFFHAAMGAKIRAGGFLFTEQYNYPVLELVTKRFMSSIMTLYGIEIPRARSLVRVKCFALVFMFDRIWWEIRSGASSAVGINPGDPFTIAQLDLLAPLLFMKMSDVFQALAIMRSELVEGWRVTMARAINMALAVDTQSEALYRRDPATGAVDARYYSMARFFTSSSMDPKKMIKTAASNISHVVRNGDLLPEWIILEALEKYMEAEIEPDVPILLRHQDVSGVGGGDRIRNTWFISVKWLELTIGQDAPESFDVLEPGASLTCAILRALRATCFENMCAHQKIILGGLSLINNVTRADGTTLPLPHVCASLDIGSPSVINDVRTTLEQAKIPAMYKATDDLIQDPKLNVEQSLYHAYLEKLDAEGHPTTNFEAMFNQFCANSGELAPETEAYPTPIIVATLKGIDEIRNDIRVSVDDDQNASTATSSGVGYEDGSEEVFSYKRIKLAKANSFSSSSGSSGGNQ